jgi:hypothetical protein
VVPLSPALLRPLLTSSSHGLLFPKKIDVAESLGSFDVQKVPESQKHAKQ